MQTVEKPPVGSKAKIEHKEIVEDNGTGNKRSSERAFADFVFGSLILHAFCVNFIN